MKKRNLLFLASVIASVSLFTACDLFNSKNEEEKNPPQNPSTQTPSINDDFINNDWQLSGNVSDYYFVNAEGKLQKELLLLLETLHKMLYT